MSTATIGRAEVAAPARRLRGLYWLVGRQIRALLWTLAVAVAVVTGLLLYLHRADGDAMAQMRQAGCLSPGVGGTRAGCWEIAKQLIGPGELFTQYLQPALVGFPLLVGMFVGAPLMAQEYERGTTRLIWTQSASRTRWLAVRIGLPGVAVVLAAGALAAITTWFWHADMLHSVVMFDPPFQGLTYPVLGLFPIAFTLFALVLGTAVGTLLRRTLPAVIVTGVLLGAVEFVLRLLRSHLVPGVYQFHQGRSDMFLQPNNAWLLSSGTVLPDGSKVAVADCAPGRPCAASHSFYLYFQPVSHFVQIQLVESGILLVLGAAILALVVRQVRSSAA